MTRVMVSESYADSPSQFNLPRIAYDLLPRLWTVADRYGCFRASPNYVWGAAFGVVADRYPEITPAVLADWFDAFEREGMLERWTEGGRTYGFWTGYFRHNALDSRYKRTTPEPPSIKEDPVSSRHSPVNSPASSRQLPAKSRSDSDSDSDSDNDTGGCKGGQQAAPPAALPAASRRRRPAPQSNPDPKPERPLIKKMWKEKSPS